MPDATEDPKTLRLVMLGTGDFALPTFEHLVEADHTVVALITQPDRPQGRKQEILPSRIKQSAQARGVTVHQPESINADDGLELLRGLSPDLLVTAAYGQILSAEALGTARMGGINLHGSILPAYRGAAPVARAIGAGEVVTGVTVIRMTPQVDAGGMIAFARTPIGPDETAGELEDRLAALGGPLIAKALADLAAGAATIIPQDRAKATKAPKLRKEDGVVDWTKSAAEVHNLVRAMHPWPMASTHWLHPIEGKPPVRLILHKTREEPATAAVAPGTVLEAGRDRLVVSAGEGAVALLRVQVPGKTPMGVEEFLRGYRISPGDRMGEPPAVSAP